MIAKREFAAGMAQLGSAFGRELDPALLRTYHAVLDPELTTEQFGVAVARCLSEDAFWPAPRVLLDKIHGNALSAAEVALRHVERTVAGAGGYRNLSYTAYTAAIDAPTHRAVHAVGGLCAIVECPSERRPALVRQFAAAYTAQPVGALAESSDSPALLRSLRGAP